MSVPAPARGALGVKQYVAELNGPWHRLRVFTTGDDRFYLFQPLTPDGDDFGMDAFPVRKADLRPDVRSALRHGWGHGPHRLSRAAQNA